MEHKPNFIWVEARGLVCEMKKIFQTTELGKWFLSLNPPPEVSPPHPQVDTPKASKERRKTEDMGSFLSNEEAQALILTDCLCPLPSHHCPPHPFSLSLTSLIRLSVDDLAGYCWHHLHHQPEREDPFRGVVIAFEVHIKALILES